MRQSGAETLVTEEPYELIAHVRICGGAGWVTTGSTRKSFVDTDFGEVSVTLITPVGIRLQHDVIISKLDLA
jgi:hypothetical protein